MKPLQTLFGAFLTALMYLHAPLSAQKIEKSVGVEYVKLFPEQRLGEFCYIPADGARQALAALPADRRDGPCSAYRY